MKKTITQEKAIKKVEIAIDKMIDLQDAGYNNDTIIRILEQLNELSNRI